VPGLVGVVARRDGAAAASRRFSIGCDRMRRHAGMAVEEQIAFDGWCRFGRVYLESSAASSDLPRPAVSDTAPVAVFHGVLHNEASLRSTLRAPVPPNDTSALIAAAYDAYGLDFVSRLDGEFCLALADPRERRLLVATDTIGHYLVHWRADADGLFFSSDLSALLRSVDSGVRLDLRAVADYLTIGAVLGDKTLAQGVRVLDPGTVLLYDAARGQVALRPYARLETFFEATAAPKKADYLNAVQASFRRAVARATQGSRPVGLSLSGGLDSRAILSAVNGRSSALRTYTLGVDGCADQAIAQRLARIAGTEHYYFTLDNTYLRDFLPNLAGMVSLTDGMYLSHGLTEMLAVQFLEQTGIAVLLRGHGGELAKAHLAWPLHTDERIHAMPSVDVLVPYLADRASYVSRGLSLGSVLTPEAAASAGAGARDSIADALTGIRLSPANCCSYLYLRELNRRFTVPSLELFRTRVDVRLPYLDREFLTVLLAAPSSWRDTTEIHRALTAAGLPELLRVRNSNTGAPVDAGPVAEFVLDKWKSALARLNVRGYRHYHNFDHWMRTRLLETVEVELLRPSALVQSFVSTRALGELIRDTRAGKADRSYLLQVLLILELWQRENDVEAAA
jgi:asparagine synthase (glutamine-hydrolysing)